jgi:diguanylate cyclase (GGDEF)-like protein/PAS domain S-box-containing protein
MRVRGWFPAKSPGNIVTPNIDDSTADRSFMRVAWAAALAGMLAFALCLASGKLKTMAGETVPIWIVDGYLVAHIMVASQNKKFAVLTGGMLGILGANFCVGEGLYVASSFTFAGLLEICAAVALAPKINRAKELADPKAFLRFLLACSVASLLSGAVAVVLLRGFFTVHPFSSFSNWVISDALGLLIFTPTSLVVASGELVDFRKSPNRNLSLVLLCILGVATATIFSQTTYDLLYWIFPPLAVLAFQTELAVVLIGTLLCIAIAVPLTIHGSGPLWLLSFASLQQRILALQVFMLAALSVALPIALMQAQRNRLLAMLTRSERRYRMLAENADDVVLQISISGDISYASPRVTTTLGYMANALVGQNILSFVFDDDRQALVEAMSQAGWHGIGTWVIYRIRRSDSSLGWVRSFASAERGETSTSEPFLALTIRDIEASLHEQQRRKAHETELERLAYVDSLTGLFNRRHFDAELSARTTKNDGQRPERFGLLLVDVDYFKNYNDRYGHLAGDECLKAVASCIADSVRDKDVVARYGGEEFTVVIDSGESEDAATVAEHIRSAVEALRIRHQGSPFEYVTLSIGLAYARKAGITREILFGEADAALYEAKRNGRNQVRESESDLRCEDAQHQ